MPRGQKTLSFMEARLEIESAPSYEYEIYIRETGETRKVVVNIGKMAILEAVDAATGEYLFSIDTGVQNVIAAIDPETGGFTRRIFYLREEDSGLNMNCAPLGSVDPKTVLPGVAGQPPRPPERGYPYYLRRA